LDLAFIAQNQRSLSDRRGPDQCARPPTRRNDGVVRSVPVDAGAETGRTKLAGHRSHSAQLLHHDPGALEFVQIKLNRRDRLG
jgi:hypothetical protein